MGVLRCNDSMTFNEPRSEEAALEKHRGAQSYGERKASSCKKT